MWISNQIDSKLEDSNLDRQKESERKKKRERVRDRKRY